MALSPDEKFIYVNPDTTAGEYNLAQYFSIENLRGFTMFGGSDAFNIYFRGPKNGTSTRVTLSIIDGTIKEFFTQFVNEVNFGENSVITLADRSAALSAAVGGTDFVHINAYGTPIIISDAVNEGFGNVVVDDMSILGDVSASSGVSTIGTRKFYINSFTDGDYIGDVVFFGGTTSMTTGALYHYKSDGTWELADADAASTCDGMLAIALGAASDDDGMLLRGIVVLDHDPGAVGDVLFVSTTAGDITATAPSGNNDIVRIVGYCLHASLGNIWFNPDGAFVEVTA